MLLSRRRRAFSTLFKRRSSPLTSAVSLSSTSMVRTSSRTSKVKKLALAVNKSIRPLHLSKTKDLNFCKLPIITNMKISSFEQEFSRSINLIQHRMIARRRIVPAKKEQAKKELKVCIRSTTCARWTSRSWSK